MVRDAFVLDEVLATIAFRGAKTFPTLLQVVDQIGGYADVCDGFPGFFQIFQHRIFCLIRDAASFRSIETTEPTEFPLSLFDQIGRWSDIKRGGWRS